MPISTTDKSLISPAIGSAICLLSVLLTADNPPLDFTNWFIAFANKSSSSPTAIILCESCATVEAMAQDLHYTNIKWENVKSFYFPQWLRIQYQQEANFKNAQLTITSSISQSLSESGMKNDNKQEKKFE